MSLFSVRATPFSLGGAVLAGLLFFVGVLAYIAFQPAEPSIALRAVLSILWLGLFFYFIDALSERLWYESGRIMFDSLLKKRQEIVLRETEDVFVVHEGLNQERGIISVRFKERDGRVIEWSLGPLWHRHVLELFFLNVEREAGKRKMVEHVR